MSNRRHLPFDNLVRILNELNMSTPQCVFEVGARDSEETIRFFDAFPQAQIYSFECNPATLPLCRERVKGKKNITLIEKAVSDTIGKIKFYPIDQEKTETPWKDGNPGASSLFKASGKYSLEKYVQNEIEVDTTTLKKVMEDYSLNQIDVLWMDIQGAELKALTGLQEKIHRVKLIHTEVEFMEIYQGQPLYWDIKKYTDEKGFYLYDFTYFAKNISGDAVFINSAYLSPLSKAYCYLRSKFITLKFFYFK